MWMSVPTATLTPQNCFLSDAFAWTTEPIDFRHKKTEPAKLPTSDTDEFLSPFFLKAVRFPMKSVPKGPWVTCYSPPVWFRSVLLTVNSRSKLFHPAFDFLFYEPDSRKMCSILTGHRKGLGMWENIPVSYQEMKWKGTHRCGREERSQPQAMVERPSLEVNNFYLRL